MLISTLTTDLTSHPKALISSKVRCYPMANTMLIAANTLQILIVRKCYARFDSQPCYSLPVTFEGLRVQVKFVVKLLRMIAQDF